jgi:S1-C subfamily serine protease
LVDWILAAACLLLTTGLQAQAPPEKEAPDILRQLSDSFEALAKRVSPSVVQIVVTGFGPVEEEAGTNTALIAKQHITGSGVIVDACGGSGATGSGDHTLANGQRVTSLDDQASRPRY